MRAMTTGKWLVLRAGDLSAGVAPDAGGALAYLRLGAADVLRATPVGAAGAGDHASFPMLPICNRLQDNLLPVGADLLPVPPNVVGEGWHLHGTGWQARWQVVGHDGVRAEIVTAHAAAGDPWRYTAWQVFRLGGGTLWVEAAIRNDGDAAMPFAIGHHPWFARDADTLLMFGAGAMWPDAKAGLADGPMVPPTDFDFSGGRRLPMRGLDHCFEGWDGRCRIAWPSRGLAVEVLGEPPMAHLAVYADPARRDFCVEPQTMVTHAMSMQAGRRAAAGVVMLAPGESLCATIGLTPSWLRD